MSFSRSWTRFPGNLRTKSLWNLSSTNLPVLLTGLGSTTRRISFGIDHETIVKTTHQKAVEALSDRIQRLVDRIVTRCTCPACLRIQEARKKFEAGMMMATRTGIIVPTEDEWMGLNLLERDDEL